MPVTHVTRRRDPYYLHAGTEHARRRALVMVVLISLLVLLPALLVQFAAHGPPGGR